MKIDMDKYVTGAVIRKLREDRKMTQAELAEKLYVSDKTISKWETGKGLPDITLLESLAKALGISTNELLAGEDVRNQNRCANMLRSRLYVCPVCGNILFSAGNAIQSCCGITLPPLEAEPAAGDHEIRLEKVEDEWYVSMEHPMTKEHYLSFFAGFVVPFSCIFFFSIYMAVSAWHSSCSSSLLFRQTALAEPMLTFKGKGSSPRRKICSQAS